MECSIIFILAQLRNWRAGSVVAVIGSTWDENPIDLENQKTGQKEAIITALQSIRVLYDLDN